MLNIEYISMLNVSEKFVDEKIFSTVFKEKHFCLWKKMLDEFFCGKKHIFLLLNKCFSVKPTTKIFNYNVLNNIFCEIKK